MGDGAGWSTVSNPRSPSGAPPRVLGCRRAEAQPEEARPMSDRPAFPSHPARPGPARGLRAAILPILLVLAFALPAAAQVVAGSALHRERMALPPDAVFEATLQDVSRADAAAEVLGRARLDPAGQSPFRFEIPYDAARIAAGRRYVVRAEIRHEGRLLFTTDVAHPVLGAGAGREVEIVLVRVAAADAAPLAGTRWRLVALGDEPVRAADASRAPHLVFAVEGGRLSGSDGCNRMVGGYALDGARLSFSGIGATRMACPEGMEQAAAFARALHATAAHRVAGDLLELIDASGRVVARLQAEPPR
jgi:putative lipoprotein